MTFARLATWMPLNLVCQCKNTFLSFLCEFIWDLFFWLKKLYSLSLNKCKKNLNCSLKFKQKNGKVGNREMLEYETWKKKKLWVWTVMKAHEDV